LRQFSTGYSDCIDLEEILTAEALRAQSWKIYRAKTPRTQRKISSYLSELVGLCAFARDILPFLAALSG
jgi:hypothetical protein